MLAFAEIDHLLGAHLSIARKCLYEAPSKHLILYVD